MKRHLADPKTRPLVCPFCRAGYAEGEPGPCPECDVALVSREELARMDAIRADDDLEEPLPPHMELLPWTYAGRGRAALLALALVGIALFFSPWVLERSPEIRTLSGFGLAQHLTWIWAAGVAWFVMVPLVLSRRSIFKMRGARLAVGFLAAIVLTTVAVRLSFRPESTRLRPARFDWGFGLYASGAVAILTMLIASRFGGRVDDVPTQQRRQGDETLH